VLTIAHVADLHFGRRMTTISSGGDNVRELDIYRAGETVARWIVEELKPDVVVVAGDVWDTPSPGPLAVRQGFEFHRTIRSAGIPVIVIGGNHDTLTSISRLSPLQHLQRYFDCEVITEQRSLDIGGVRFECIPYRTLSSGLFTAPDWSTEVPNIVVAHATADGAELPDFAKYDNTRLPASVTHADEVTLGLLGHIHVHREVAPRVYYSGALERLTWGEIENEPSVYVHRVNGINSVDTESVPLRTMGDPLVPRPAEHVTVACAQLDAQQSVEAAEAALDVHAVAEGLLQLTLEGAPREINALPFEETLTARAKRKQVFALKVRTHLRAGAAWAFEETELQPGATLADTYAGWAGQHGYADIAETGARLIGGER
jgi:DNA repair exonuclease SbcCD nuclease subunit